MGVVQKRFDMFTTIHAHNCSGSSPYEKGLRTKKEIPVCTFFLTTCADGYFCENFCVNGKEVFLSDRWFLFDTREKIFIAKPMKQTFPLSFGSGIISREMAQKQGANTEIH